MRTALPTSTPQVAASPKSFPDLGAYRHRPAVQHYLYPLMTLLMVSLRSGDISG